MPRPPKLRDPLEPEIVPDLDALRKERDDWNSRLPVQTPVDLEGLSVLPQVSSDELDRQMDEQLKLIDGLMSRNEEQGDDDDGNAEENIGS